MIVFKSENNDASVVYDESTLTEEQKAKGLKVESLPKQEDNGLLAVLKFDGVKVWYEYVKDEQSTVESLKAEVASLQDAVLALMDISMMGGF
jgi:hypothetical protein